MKKAKFSVWEGYVRYGVFDNLADARKKGAIKSPLEIRAFETFAPIGEK